MADIYVYADEAGNFDFSLKQGATRYFVIATVTLAPASVGTAITDLRYKPLNASQPRADTTSLPVRGEPDIRVLEVSPPPPSCAGQAAGIDARTLRPSLASGERHQTTASQAR